MSELDLWINDHPYSFTKNGWVCKSSLVPIIFKNQSSHKKNLCEEQTIMHLFGMLYVSCINSLLNGHSRQVLRRPSFLLSFKFFVQIKIDFKYFKDPLIYEKLFFKTSSKPIFSKPKKIAELFKRFILVNVWRRLNHSLLV